MADLGGETEDLGIASLGRRRLDCSRLRETWYSAARTKGISSRWMRKVTAHFGDFPSVGRTGESHQLFSLMAASHAVIMDAVYVLLEEKSVRDLTIEAVAKRAGVGKPTLYKGGRPKRPWCWRCSVSGWRRNWRSRPS
jgi:hypothetical protein